MTETEHQPDATPLRQTLHDLAVLQRELADLAKGFERELAAKRYPLERPRLSTPWDRS